MTALVATVAVGCATTSPEPVVEDTSDTHTRTTATPTDGLVVPSPRPPTPPTPAPSDPGPDGLASPRTGPSPTAPSSGPSSDEQVPDEPGTRETEEEGMAVDGVPDRVLDAVLAAASDHADVAPADIVVVAAERVTFRDGSLDCPQPGRQYTQALVDGFRVVVEADGDRLDYRMALDGAPRLCVGGARPLPPSDV